MAPHPTWKQKKHHPWRSQPPERWRTVVYGNRSDRRRIACELHRTDPNVKRTKFPLNVVVAQLRLKRGEALWPTLPKRLLKQLGLRSKSALDWTNADMIRVGALLPTTPRKRRWRKAKK